MAACFAAAKGPWCETVFSYLFYDFYCGGKLVPSVMVTLFIPQALPTLFYLKLRSLFLDVDAKSRK